MTLFGEPTKPQTEIIRALWWNQPYATLMLPPYLKDETRTRPTNVRGKVLICACKEPYEFTKVHNEISGAEQTNRIWQAFGECWPTRFNLPLGQAIGIGTLTRCFPMQPIHADKCFVQYREPWIEVKEVWVAPKYAGDLGHFKKIETQRRLWVWHFENVQKIEPFEINGKQGWAILDEETKAKIKIL